MKVLLRQIEISRESYSTFDGYLYLICSTYYGEWKSKPSLDRGLCAKWPQSLMTIDFKENLNVINMQVKTSGDPSGPSFATGKTPVEALLTQGIVDVDLYFPDTTNKIGFVRFECFHGDAPTQD